MPDKKKTIQVNEEAWRRLKMIALDRDLTIAEVVELLLDLY